ncbi:hypothetical protein A8H35_17365 [Burkholderia thailandensis]|uniref:Uncharacterized protein n=1 Tax=Burkholderia thailandensis (strain ATCC 700388 / DSM 13276 / CCUG 48851 / CIP 106301 / E264) TaxID=271848 RepID=Q2SVD4_BURTA|nr:hypothetical protein BTH_I2600 [Burkholderia thailandensis E264]AVR10517.1 hypothetical protein A8H31_25145 [Burkholderia thailandensis]AWY59872.1 hypothetical protein A8H35_17365 [Burkholderia thailandensis]AWY69019.1 hypothetical protein A8H36_29900 [Burkholderia thailandensis]NOK42884.1 hypothetical protein [Burkholderia thailandensis]
MEGIGEQPAESSEKWASWVCVFAEPSVGNESGKVNYTAALSHAPRMRAAPFSGRGIGVHGGRRAAYCSGGGASGRAGSSNTRIDDRLEANPAFQ